MQTRSICHRPPFRPEACRPIRSPSAARRIRRRVQHSVTAAAAANGTLVGIDLGTSNSAISVIEGGRARILPDEHGNSVTPSVVSYTEVHRFLACGHHDTAPLSMLR